MLEDIREVFTATLNIQPELPIIVGVSGGPDSLCMLDILHRLGFRLLVAHFDHSLRQTSASEASFVREIAKQMGIPFLLGNEDVKEYAKRSHLSIEEAARQARYAFFFQQAEANEAQAVAVGHTSDDQVETVLMHLLRGSGLEGLKGMSFQSLPNAWSQRIPIIRPILTQSRQQVTAYNKSRNLSPVFDHSNLDTTFFRNRLRHEFIPELESYNPQIKKSILRMSDTIGEDYKLIENAVDSEWGVIVDDKDEDFIALNLPHLRKQPLGMQRRIIRKAANHICPGLRDIDFRAVRRASDFIEMPSRSGQMDLISNIYLLIEGDRLWLSKWNAELPTASWPQLQVGAEYFLKIPGIQELPDNWFFEIQVASNPGNCIELSRENCDPFQVWLDSSGIKSPLKIRSRRPGDRFKPFGMGGRSVKISDFMVNHKLPRRARGNWPIVLSGQDIIWMPGFTIAHGWQITRVTRSVVNLTLSKK